MIIENYNKQRVIRYQSGYSSVTEMTEVNNVEVLEISENTVTARIGYRWKAVEYTYIERSDRGIATVTRIGPSYKVVSFE